MGFGAAVQELQQATGPWEDICQAIYGQFYIIEDITAPLVRGLKYP